ncbi:ROK family transcriptional regulator [Bifidobacterium olomucense]|uniref:NagC family transcriptional regulator n=1 Tax=Bifidobacterium olomucense TaxID=2675324 RepID=A0A7Y0EWI1_9BIFI|nr:ROK family transcriptional regulator [Bifidobacterium sp. DSM 109959]NMM97730.1 NagC family transcriptional regulator [Bifidobacterium sp. DSM 109959]
MPQFALNPTPDGHNGKASPADARRRNRQLIFSLLFPTNQYSRAELGRRTGLSRVAVSEVVSQMLEEGLLRETGQAPSTGKGKRGTLLSVDTDRLRIISLDLTQEFLLHGAVTNLLGQPLRHTEIALEPNAIVSIADIIALIEETLTMADGPVIGIGIASPGVISNGVVLSATMRGWTNVDLRTPIETHFGIDVTAGNDATAGMLTERFFGKGGSNMLFVRIGRGIGSAVLLNDAPIIGELHAAGEIGHISIDLHGPQCPCGKRGCLETLISGAVLRKQMESAARDEQQRMLTQAGYRLAQALAMPVGLLDLADVCVYGQPDIVNPIFIDAAQQYMDDATASAFHKHTTIRRCECGPDITIQGQAIAVVLHHLAK